MKIEKQPIRIAVLVSGGGTNLQALIDAQRPNAQGKVILHSGKIVAVIASKPGVYALSRAESAGIPAYVADRSAGQAAFEAQISEYLAQSGAEMIVLAGFLSILSADFVSRWPRRILNVHPALIPAFCGKGYYGLRVHEAALAAGVKVTGATVHLVNEIPDGGEILMQRAVRVCPGDTPETLQRRVMEQAEWKLLPRAAESVCRRLQREKALSAQ